MNVNNPSSFNHRTERLSTGRTYHFVDQKPERYDFESTPVILCVHGFPDFWYGWRYQISPWVKSGYRVVVPDMLGYGDTDKPSDPSEYSTRLLANDLAALLNIVGVQKAVIIGHDWGSYVVSRFALWHPDRLLCLIQMSVAYTPPAPMYISIDEIARRHPNLAYQAYFADPVSTKELEGNLDVVLASLYHRPTGGPNHFTKFGQSRDMALNGKMPPLQDTVLSSEELGVYISNFKKGMNGPLNYYRTTKIRYDEEKEASLPSCLPDTLPALLFWGTEDTTCLPSVVARSHKFVPALRDIRLQGCGHWVMVEAKTTITDGVLQFLTDNGIVPHEKAKL